MEVDIAILKKKDSTSYTDRGILTLLFIVSKVDAHVTKQFVMSFEMTHMLKKTISNCRKP